jgi:phage gp45-like
MDNYLNSGGVLPSGLLSGNDSIEKMAAFNKTYRNYPLRMGIVDKIYAYDDPNNFSKLTTEYDLLIFEQNLDRGSTILTYKNCIASDGLGSIADYFEKNLRQKTVNNNPAGILNTTYQNGAIVILLCLDGVSEKAVIVGGINHPDRPTNLTTTEPQLYGEYNGVAVVVNPDGSTSLTFKGQTDSYGVPTDASQGSTVVEIERDGTFQVANSEVTIRMDKTSKELTLSSTGNWTVNIQGNTNITTQGDANIIAQGNTVVDGASIKLGANASHPLIFGDLFMALFNSHVHPTGVGPSGPPTTPMPASDLSTKVTTE